MVNLNIRTCRVSTDAVGIILIGGSGVTKDEKYYSIESFRYTEIQFNIDDVCFSIHYSHRFNADNALPLEYKTEESRRADFLHTHPYYEMFFPDADGYVIDLKDSSITAGRSDVVIISPKTLHSAKSDGKLYCYCILFSYSKNALYRKGGLYDLLSDVLSAEYIHVKKSMHHIEEVKSLYRHLDSGRVLMASRYFMDIMSSLLFYTENVPTVDPIDMLPDSDIRRQRGIEALISRHYSENISLAFMAEKLNLSVRQTSRLIKARCGKTLGELVLEKRMAAAKNYLESGDMKISEIASRVGYNSLACFYDAYKKYYGELPGKHKKHKE